MTAIPEDEDPDEIFAAMTADLDFEAPTVVLADLDDQTLMRRWTHVKIELRERKEMHSQRTERGRELQSEYQAIKYLLHERGLLP